MLAAGTQLMVTVALGVFVGRWVDAKFQTDPWFMLAGAILGISVGLYNLIREASRQQGR